MYLAEAHVRSIVQPDIHRGAGIIFDSDVLEVRYEADFADRLFMLLHVLVALG